MIHDIISKESQLTFDLIGSPLRWYPRTINKSICLLVFAFKAEGESILIELPEIPCFGRTTHIWVKVYLTPWPLRRAWFCFPKLSFQIYLLALPLQHITNGVFSECTPIIKELVTYFHLFLTWAFQDCFLSDKFPNYLTPVFCFYAMQCTLK